MVITQHRYVAAGPAEQFRRDCLQKEASVAEPDSRSRDLWVFAALLAMFCTNCPGL